MSPLTRLCKKIESYGFVRLESWTPRTPAPPEANYVWPGLDYILATVIFDKPFRGSVAPVPQVLTDDPWEPEPHIHFTGSADIYDDENEFIEALKKLVTGIKDCRRLIRRIKIDSLNEQDCIMRKVKQKI